MYGLYGARKLERHVGSSYLGFHRGSFDELQFLCFGLCLRDGCSHEVRVGTCCEGGDLLVRGLH